MYVSWRPALFLSRLEHTLNTGLDAFDAEEHGHPIAKLEVQCLLLHIKMPDSNLPQGFRQSRQ